MGIHMTSRLLLRSYVVSFIDSISQESSLQIDSFIWIEPRKSRELLCQGERNVISGNVDSAGMVFVCSTCSTTVTQHATLRQNNQHHSEIIDGVPAVYDPTFIKYSPV